MLRRCRNAVDQSLARKAFEALLAFHRKRSESRPADVLGGDEKVFMTIALKRIPKKPSPKPFRIPLPHPPRAAGECDMCLFMKKEDKPWVKEALVESRQPVAGLKKIITLDKLRTSYARFEKRRELLATYDLFLADDRILPMLCKALGKTFFANNRQPVPVRVTRRQALPKVIERARDSTYLVMPAGSCASVCLGHTGMPADHLTANLLAAVNVVVGRITRKWRNVQSIQVKTETSTALPVLSKLPFAFLSEGERAEGEGQERLKGEDDGDSDDDDDDDGEEEEEEVEPERKKRKKKENKGMEEERKILQKQSRQQGQTQTKKKGKKETPQAKDVSRGESAEDGPLRKKTKAAKETPAEDKAALRAKAKVPGTPKEKGQGKSAGHAARNGDVPVADGTPLNQREEAKKPKNAKESGQQRGASTVTATPKGKNSGLSTKKKDSSARQAERPQTSAAASPKDGGTNKKAKPKKKTKG